MQALFNPEHAIFGCPKVLQFWRCIITYVMKVNHQFDDNLSFITIISLGLHNMAVVQDYTSNIVTATHNIIGLGIKTLTKFPIDSSEYIDNKTPLFLSPKLCTTDVILFLNKALVFQKNPENLHMVDRGEHGVFTKPVRVAT